MGKKSLLAKLLCAGDGKTGKMNCRLVLSIACTTFYPALIYLVGLNCFVKRFYKSTLSNFPPIRFPLWTSHFESNLIIPPPTTNGNPPAASGAAGGSDI
jgi:hypothetical protein